MPNGPEAEVPGLAVEQEPKTLGESKRGTHSQSIVPSGATSAAVWQSDRNPYDAIGENGEGAAALASRVAGPFGSVSAVMTPPTGRASRRAVRRRSSASGPHVPFAYGWTGGGASSSGCMIRHCSSTPS